MSTGLYSGVSGLALGVGLYKGVPGLWGGASGLITGDGSSLSLDFLTSNTLDPRVTFSRTTNATLVDATGWVTYAPNNLVLYSEEFENVYWTKSDTTVTANATAAPNGTTTADAVFETVTNSVHTVQRTAITITAGTSTTLSMYVKANGRDNVDLRIQGSTGQAIGRFILVGNGTFTTINSGTGVTTAASITPLSNGWYRVSVTGVASATDTSVGAFIYLRDGTNTTYAGDPTKGVFIWGAQYEQVTYQTLPSTYVQTVASAYYGPRFDYNPVTLAANGLLIEEQRVNLLLYSEQFNDATWTKLNGSIAANTTTSPDGTTNADAFIENTAASAFHSMGQAVTKAASSIVYAGSFYLKNKGRQVSFNLNNAAGSSGVQGRVNPATGTVTQNATAFGSGFTAGAITITNVGNGWYRVVMTATSDTSTTVTFALALHNGTSNVYTGDGVSGAFLWGAQLEAGAFATSYIPTVASTVTRTVDIASMTGTNFSSWYNQSEGTIVAQFVATTTGVNSTGGNTFPFVYEIDSAAASTSNHQLILSAGYGPGWNASTTILGVAQATLGAAMSLGNASVRKIAYAYQTNNFAASANGGAVVTDTSGTLPSPDRIGIGCQNSDGGNPLTGYMRTLTFYPSRLTNAQLQALTA